MGARCCPICEAAKLPSICPACVNQSVAEKRRALQRAAHHRDALLQRLNERLAAVQAAEQQRQWKMEHRERREWLLERIRRSKEELARAKERLERRQRNQRMRASQLVDSCKKLTAIREQLIVQYYPDLLRNDLLRLTVVESEAVKWRQLAVQRLRQVLPLRLTLMDVPSSWDGPAPAMQQAVTICGARLPEGDDVLSVPPLELAAALGYLLQFVSLTARYLSTPLLHIAGHGGSSSRIWQRDTYWDARPGASGDLPLFLPRTTGSSGSRSLSGSGHSNSSRSAASGNPLSPTSPPTSSSGGEPSSRTGAGSKASVDLSNSEATKEVRKALGMLRRSVACVCAGQWASLGVSPSSTWTPLYALAVLMSQLARPPHPGVAPVGESSRGSSSPRAPGGGWDGGASWSHASFTQHAGMGVLGGSRPSQEAQLLRESTGGGSSGSLSGELEEDSGRDVAAEDSGLDGWDLVERPALPPPPSEPEDVDHWTRAMFIDARK